MLSERIAPLAVGSGLLWIVLGIVAALFFTDFPATGRIKALGGYRVIAGGYFALAATVVILFCVSSAIVVLNPT